MNSIQELTDKFLQIKAKGFVPNTRPNNQDGGIGNTLEDLLEIKENNLTQADFKGIEIKSQRLFNSSYITLFSKAPTHPKRANNYLRETFGEVRQEEHSDKKILYASIFAHRPSTVYDKYKMSLQINHNEQRLYLIVTDLNNKTLSNDIYWDFQTLQKATQKLKNLLLAFADTQTQNNQKYHHFTKAQLYLNFNFDKFLTELQNGSIMFDIRIGVYNSGKSYGKTHDHGSGFRIKKENFHLLYNTTQTIQ
jgi:hypothetical protein